MLSKKLLVEGKTYLAHVGTLLFIDIRLIFLLLFVDILLQIFLACMFLTVLAIVPVGIFKCKVKRLKNSGVLCTIDAWIK